MHRPGKLSTMFPAYLYCGHDQLRVSLKRPQEGEVDACHDGRPSYLVCCCLQQHRSIALGVVGIHVFVQDLIPCMADGAINCEAIRAKPQTPACNGILTENMHAHARYQEG